MWILLAAILLSLAGFYAFKITAFARGLRMILDRPPNPPAECPYVSIIVPARDEAHCIAKCLTSILANDYPESCFELIVVDDLSEDVTVAVARQVQREHDRILVTAGGEVETESRLKIIRMPENLVRTRAHKKRAIEKGIGQARGEIILTTDADCVVPSSWIRAMVNTFDTETAFVSGPVLYRTGRSPWVNIQALEFLGLVSIGAGAIGIKRPNMCNGANVAYRRDVFLEMDGFRGIDLLTSGDDELLMQKIAYGTDWKVHFCPSAGAAVITDAVRDLRGFFQQRRRWASKGAHYPHRGLVRTIATIYLFYAALLLAPLAALVYPSLWPMVGLAFFLKLVSELMLLAPATAHFGRSGLLWYFLPAQLLQIPYVVFIGAAGLMGGYRWKGRSIQR